MCFQITIVKNEIIRYIILNEWEAINKCKIIKIGFFQPKNMAQNSYPAPLHKQTLFGKNFESCGDNKRILSKGDFAAVKFITILVVQT